MSYLRPEAAAFLRRWRAALIGAVALLAGLWLALNTYGALFLIGCGLAAFGAALVVSGIQRARFQPGGGQVGVVEVVERRVTYYGPFGGGAVSLDTLRHLAIHPHPAWLLTDESGERLMIPLGAEGADSLFEAFIELPGLSASALIAATRDIPDAPRTLWQRGRTLTSRV